MRVKNPTIIEVDELVFTAATNARDARALDGPALCRRHSPFERRMVDHQGGDSPADKEPAQMDHGAFDFGKLRHVR